MQWEEMIIMDRKEVIEKFQKPERENHWEEEQSLDLITPQQATLHVSRIKYIGENAEKDNEKKYAEKIAIKSLIVFIIPPI